MERAQAAARAGGGLPANFDREHLRGRVHFDVGVPFEADPVLDFLREKRGLRVGPPHTTSLDQPVAYLVGQLAAATVLAAHGESPPMVLLSGGAGALGIAREDESRLALSLPLERYAGVALVPVREAAHAVSAAARALHGLLAREVPAAASGPFGHFLARECGILDAVAARGESAAPLLDPRPVAPADFASLTGLAAAEERAGAHVVPYWASRDLAGDGTRVAFEPLRAARREGSRGSLALSIAPAGARLFVAALPGAPDREAALRAHLSRPVPFVVQLDKARAALVRVDAAPGTLPMAPEGDP